MDQNNRQHFYPRFCLKNWGPSGKLYCQNLLTKRISRIGVRRVGMQENFYTVRKDDRGQPFDYDSIFTKIENDASIVIRDILAKRSLQNLNQEKLGIFIQFICWQYHRTNFIRSASEGITRNLENILKSLYPKDKDKIKVFWKDVKSQNLSVISEFTKDLFYEIYSMNHVLLRSPEGNPRFITSDEPVILNSLCSKWVGLKTATEIYFPLSPRICFAARRTPRAISQPITGNTNIEKKYIDYINDLQNWFAHKELYALHESDLTNRSILRTKNSEAHIEEAEKMSLVDSEGRIRLSSFSPRISMPIPPPR